MILTFTDLIMKSIGMLFGIYVSNKIGSEALGTFNLVMSIYSFAIILTTSGFSLSCTYLVSEQFEKGNLLDGLKAVRSCLIFSLILGLVVSFFMFLVSDMISRNYLKGMISPIPIYLISIGLPFIAISSSINGYFSAIRKAYKSAMSQVVELMVKIFTSIFFLNFYADKTVESICICLILADVISEICSCCLLFILYKIEKLKTIKYTITKFTFKKKIIKIALPLSITFYIRSGLSTLKQFMIPARLVLFGLPYSIALTEYREN